MTKLFTQDQNQTLLSLEELFITFLAIRPIENQIIAMSTPSKCTVTWKDPEGPLSQLIFSTCNDGIATVVLQLTVGAETVIHGVFQDFFEALEEELPAIMELAAPSIS